MDHIDTAEYYGPTVVNELIKEALHPYSSELTIVSKVGAARGSRGEIFAADQPKELRGDIEANLRSLGIDQLAVVNLRLMRDSAPDAFFDEQLHAMVRAREDGLIGAVGLSNVSLAHLQHAVQLTEVACVQNEYNPVDRASQLVLNECDHRGIAFVPFAPLGFGSTSVLRNPVLARVAARLGCTPAQACLSWELSISPNLLLIPGTSSQAHLMENLEAVHVELDSDAFESISQLSLLSG